MARITGMVFGLALLIIISSMASPASAWDSDDDDNHRARSRHHHHYHAPPIIAPPVVRQPILAPPRYVEDRGNYYGHDYPTYPGPALVPQYEAVPEYSQTHVPLAPPPLPPDQLFGTTPPVITEPLVTPPVPEIGVGPECRPGQFVDFEASLYPYVRVKGADEVPRFAVHQIIAVRSPDPFRFPGLVYVQVCVPPGPCRDIKVKDGGARIQMKYNEFEVEVVSSRGIVSVEYDD